MVIASGGLLCGTCGIASTSTSPVLKPHQSVLKSGRRKAEELSSLLLLSSHRSKALSSSIGHGRFKGRFFTGASKGQIVVPISCREDGRASGTGATADTSERSTREQESEICRPVSRIECLQTATKFACRDAKLMSAAARSLDVRARNDLTMLKQGILRLDMRARQDVALIGSGFLKLDARAREDTEKLDMQARQKVKRLRLLALGLQEIARVEAEEHWNNGALDADLRLADLRARRRAMEDAYTSFQAVKNIHDTLMRIVRMREDPNFTRTELKAVKDTGEVKTEFRTGSVALDRLLELEEAYNSVASLLAETEGMDYTDPDELEFIVATLLDMEEVDGRSGASLLAECSTSPDVETRRALADALADAPSLWTLGNAGMGALQKLAKDSNPVVADAATRALQELKDQLNVDDSFFFPRSFGLPENSDPEEDPEDS